MANSSTVIPERLATMKCPNSWTKINRLKISTKAMIVVKITFLSESKRRNSLPVIILGVFALAKPDCAAKKLNQPESGYVFSVERSFLVFIAGC
jgi:hypothetical protein